MSASVHDLGWEQIKRETRRLERHAVKVGIQADETYEDGTDLLDIAIYNEFGTETIPSRPFMRQTADMNRANAAKVGERYYDMILAGQMTAFQALQRVGEWYQGVNRKSVRETPWVPNAPLTIAKKGSNKPLIDKGKLVNSIRWEMDRL